MLFVSQQNIYLIDEIIRRISNGESDLFLLFETSYLKNIFFNNIKKYFPNTYIINCCSSKRRLEHDLSISKEYDLIIYDNINAFNNADELYILNKQKIYIK
jgi:hypothetical protein